MKTSALTAIALMTAFHFSANAQQTPPPARPATPAPQPSPAKHDEPDPLPPPDLLFLTGMPKNATPDKIIAYARATSARAASITDLNLKFILRATLARLEDNPANAQAIMNDHMMSMSDYFYDGALAAEQSGNIEEAGKAVQVALRINPDNAKARILFANLLHVHGKNTDAAIQTLQYGKQFLPLGAAIAPAYLDRYYQLLESVARDRDVIADADVLLALTGYPPATREVIALHAAQSYYWIGEYAKCLEVIANNGFDELAKSRLKDADALISAATPENGNAAKGKRDREFALERLASVKLLESRAYYGTGNTGAATSKLEKAAGEFSGPSRDAILSQVGRFYAELGDYSSALSIVQQRISEFPDNPFPRIHKLYLLERTGRQDLFKQELAGILEKFSANSGAMTALAEFASKYGHTDICARCAQIAEQNNYNRLVFVLLVIESMIRAERPADAMAYYKGVLAIDPTFFRESQGGINALMGIVYLQNKDASTGRAFLHEFLQEKRNDKATLQKIEELTMRRDGKFKRDANGQLQVVVAPAARTYEEKRAISDEIKRISYRPRQISANEYISVGFFLNFVKASEDALRILENGVRRHPNDSQLKADYISTRVLCGAFEKYGSRKSLVEEVEELLKMRRPLPTVWPSVLLWLDTDKTVPAEKAEELRAIAKKLSRPDLDLSLMTGREQFKEN